MDDPTDDDVWAQEVQDVKRLDGKALKTNRKSSNKDHTVCTKLPTKQAPKATDQSVYSSDIDARTLQRLKRGQIRIEARLDLHGMSRHQAYDALHPFLTGAQAAGKRCVLVITGKGQKGYEMQGILRAALPEWLDESRYRPLVLTHVPAHKRDGGGGAFYVYLRRAR